MSAAIPEAYQDLLTGNVYPTLVTVMPDGQPQASIVWFSYDGTHILVNTAKGRQKDKNMKTRPQVTLLFVDPTSPMRFMEIRGRVAEATEEGAIEHINALSARYDGIADFFGDKPERRSTETRVIFKIEPVRVVTHGD